jgi:hypothetical protein
MSNKKSTTSYGGDDRGSSKKEHKKIIKEIKRAKNVSEGTKYVKEKLGLVEKKAGPMDYLQKGKTTGVYASKLHGTKGGMDFYGQETKQASMDFIKNQPSSSGLYAVTSSGTMITDSSGNPILSSKGKQLLSGKSGGAMGSGDRSGIMGSIPISQPMHKSQQKIQGILMGGLSLAVPGVAGTAMRGMALSSFSKMGREGYSDYLTKFYSGLSSGSSSKKITSSLGIKKTDSGSGGGGGEVSSYGMINTSATGDNTQITKFKKKKAGQGADTVASRRSLLATSAKTITGYMA